MNGVEVMRRLFPRELDTHQMFFAIGETLAHLNYLIGHGKILLQKDIHGVNLYHRE
jgi:hypothetical protein